MARPQKEGVDYFPVDCQFSDSAKFIGAEFGLIGYGCLVRMWQKIYGGKGYYTKWDDDVALMFAQENKVGVNVVKEVISACIRRGIFDRDMFDRYGILTSEGIQERYAEATERRVSQKIEGRYLLIAMPSNWVNVDNNPINVDNNPINVDDNSQSKVNNNKLNNINTIKTSAGAPARYNKKLDPPSGSEVFVYFRDEHDAGSPSTETAGFMAYNQNRGWACLPDWKAAADLWMARKR